MSDKIDYFDGIREHFNALETKVIEVPEWGLVGEKAIHSKPFNMLEKPVSYTHLTLPTSR